MHRQLSFQRTPTYGAALLSAAAGAAYIIQDFSLTNRPGSPTRLPSLLPPGSMLESLKSSQHHTVLRNISDLEACLF